MTGVFSVLIFFFPVKWKNALEKLRKITQSFSCGLTANKSETCVGCLEREGKRKQGGGETKCVDATLISLPPSPPPPPPPVNLSDKIWTESLLTQQAAFFLIQAKLFFSYAQLTSSYIHKHCLFDFCCYTKHFILRFRKKASFFHSAEESLLCFWIEQSKQRELCNQIKLCSDVTFSSLLTQCVDTENFFWPIYMWQYNRESQIKTLSWQR